MTVDPLSRWNALDTALGERTALVVEDDPHLQRAMTRELARLKFRVLSASHFEAAVLHLTTRVIHVVCVDIGLPSESGYELCEHIRGTMRLTRVPIIATSEHGTSQDMAHAEHARANAFLLKPFTMRQLGQCVQSLLDRRPGRVLPVHELARRYEGPGDGSPTLIGPAAVAAA
jgi:DNA-binding response OmpR family regulator